MHICIFLWQDSGNDNCLKKEHWLLFFVYKEKMHPINKEGDDRMERLNWKIPICILAIVTAFNGCTAQEPIKSYTLPNVSEDEITTEAESIVEKLAKEKHVAPQLTDDFVSSYLDMEDFAELKERAKEGIAIPRKKQI